MLLQLSESSQIIGLFSLIQAGIMISISLIVLKKAHDIKSKPLYFLFIFMYFSSSTLFPFLTGYIGWLIGGFELPYTLFAFLGTFLIPVSFIGWFLVYLSLSNFSKNMKKGILSLIIIYSISFEIYLMFFLFISPSAPVVEMIGILIERSDFSLSGFVLFYVMSMVILNLITGIHFSTVGIKSESRTAKLKGKIVLVAFIFIFLETIIEGFLLSGEGNLIMERIIGGLIDVSSFLLLYIGFLLPKWFRKISRLEDLDM